MQRVTCPTPHSKVLTPLRGGGFPAPLPHYCLKFLMSRTERGFYKRNLAPLTCSQTQPHQDTCMAHGCSQVTMHEVHRTNLSTWVYT